MKSIRRRQNGSQTHSPLKCLSGCQQTNKGTCTQTDISVGMWDNKGIFYVKMLILHSNCMIFIASVYLIDDDLLTCLLPHSLRGATMFLSSAPLFFTLLGHLLEGAKWSRSIPLLLSSNRWWFLRISRQMTFFNGGYFYINWYEFCSRFAHLTPSITFNI